MADAPVSAAVKNRKYVFWLCTHSLDLENAAESKYKDFGAAIRGLDWAVTRLKSLVEQPTRLHGPPSNGVHGLEALPHDPDLITRAAEIFKDFKTMLVDCEILLIDNAHFQTDSNNFVRNIFWGKSTQTEVNTLQHRISALTQETLLLLSTISLETGHPGAEDVSSITRDHEPSYVQFNLSLDPFPISQILITKFRDASQRDPPLGFRSPEDFPLGHGFAALRGHMHQSTTKSPPGTRQPVHQYLSLLKAQWVLQCIQQLPAFKALDLWDKDKIDAQYYEDVIAAELTRSDLTRWRHEDIVRLPDNHFLIWDARPISVVQNPMNAFRGERQILYTPSGYNGYELVVFRVLQHPTGTGVRVVRKPVAADPEFQLAPEPLVMDSFKDKLIPLYALPKSREEAFSLGLQKRGYADESLYSFDSLTDVFKLQSALTCYNVVSDTENVDWAIARPSVFRSPRGEAGRVQIWMWDPNNALAQAASTVDSESDSDGRSVVSQLTAQSAITILQDSEMPHISVSTKSQTKYSITEVIEAVMPYEPLLIVYSKHGGRYCYLCLELRGEIDIDPTTCNCSKKQDRCRRVVFKNRSGGNLTVQRVVARTIDIDDLPDLNIFARSFRKGEAAHPQFGNEHTVEKITGGHFVLDFASVALRQRFNNHFAITRKLRRSIESTDVDLESHARHVADRPQGRGNPHDRIVGPSRNLTLTNLSSPSVNSDRTPRQVPRSRTSPYPGSATPQGPQQQHQRSSFGDPRRDSAVFSAPASRVPSIAQPSELEDRNGSPTELDGHGAPWHSQSHNRPASHRRGSVDVYPVGPSSAQPQRRNNDVWNPDPGGSQMAQSRGTERPRLPMQSRTYSDSVNGSSRGHDWSSSGRARGVYELS